MYAEYTELMKNTAVQMEKSEDSPKYVLTIYTICNDSLIW